MTSKATPAAWQLFYFKLFKEALDELEQTVTQLAQKINRARFICS